MRELLKTHFGYDTFRPLQEEIMQTVLDRKDALVLMPTGGGKSLCYQLPALVFSGMTIVISPLIALMKDQVDSLVANGISAAFLNSSLSADEISAIERQVTNGRLKILYLAPERLTSPGFKEFLSTVSVAFIAIDEAHCISEWGHDFRPDYRHLKDLRKLFPSVPVMALTATATPRVREDIVKQLSMQKAKVFLSSFNRPNLHYSIRPKANAFNQLVQLLKPYQDKPVIIYCFSRKDTESLSDDLNRAGFKALPYHAGLEREVRKQTQEKFIRDEIAIIVATIAFGMGIDKPDVRLVAHMDLPKTIEGYYQETGRAGRDGLPSDCVLFYSFGDKRKQEYFIDMIINEEEQAMARKKLAQVIDYCETSACRRKFLMEYFAEEWNEAHCLNCDNCVAPKQEESDATEIAKKILSTVLQTGEMFGAAYVCDVLRGSRKERILENNHERLAVYGAGRTISADDLRAFILQLQKRGYLEKNEGEYPTLRLGRLGKTALTEETTILLPKSATISSDVSSSTPSSKRKSNGLPPIESELFEQLRQLRKEIADRQNVPPFIIFGDRTLLEMAHYLPQTIEAMASIFGVGARKLEDYGAAFLLSIQTFAKSHQLTSLAHPKEATRSIAPIINRTSSTFQKTKELIENKLSIADMARERGVTEGTIIQHIVSLISDDSELEIAHLKPSDERLQKIKQAFQTAGTTMLAPAKTILGDDYSYDELRLARLFIQ